jgi:hypothetical protein
MRIIDEAFMEMPWYGSRQTARHLRRQGWRVGRKRVRRLMRKIGLSPIHQTPKTSKPHPQHRIYPYLLRPLAIERPDQVWCADLTLIPMRRGFLYLVAIMDWFSRKALAWRLSNTMDADFCVAALEEAIARHGRPDIFNTDNHAAKITVIADVQLPCHPETRQRGVVDESQAFTCTVVDHCKHAEAPDVGPLIRDESSSVAQVEYGRSPFRGLITNS